MDSAGELKGIADQICARRNAELVGGLGQGAFKQAFHIRENGQSLALKVATATPSLIPRFEREAMAMHECSHSGIALLHTSAPQTFGAKQYWISVEEFLSGGTLGELTAGGPMPPDMVSVIGSHLIGALMHLHERRLVHRDIKPANILFRKPGQAVLTDFGIVRMLDAPALTKEFIAPGPGTPLYAAPEQLTNEIRLIDSRTDQFGLAVVLAECILGHHPFAPDGDQQAAVMRVATRQSLPAATIERLRANQATYLLRALSPWPVQRYPNPAEFIARLFDEG